MPILKFRKYFFVNLTSLWSLVAWWFLINFLTTDFAPPRPNDTFAEAAIAFSLIAYYIFGVLFWLYGFTILEFLIRKFIIEKKFPNLKINLKIKIPKWIISTYNLIFSIEFIVACALLLYLILLLFAVLLIFIPFAFISMFQGY